MIKWVYLMKFVSIVCDYQMLDIDMTLLIKSLNRAGMYICMIPIYTSLSHFYFLRRSPCRRERHTSERSTDLGGGGRYHQRPHLPRHLRHRGSSATRGAGCDPALSERRYHCPNGDRRQCEHCAFDCNEMRHSVERRRLSCHRRQGIQSSDTRSYDQSRPLGPLRQGLAESASAGAVLAAGQVHAGQRHHQQPAESVARGGGCHRRRHQRWSCVEEGRCWLCDGYCWHRCGQRSLGHHSHRW